jgi:glycosyltransferase involved in cell wall biosynthesis
MISIVTCVFNQDEQLFRACSKSVEAVVGKFEWIIVDDGSDPTFCEMYDKIIGDLRSPFHIRKISLETNSGLSVARNIGISNAVGDWIVVLDSDDEISPEIVNALSSLDSKVSLVCCRAEYLKIDGTIEIRAVSQWEKLFKKFAFSIVDPFLWYDFYYHGLIARRSIIDAIGGYNNTLRIGEDQDILLRACESIPLSGITFIDRVGYRYRENPFGVCNTHWSEVEKNYTSTMVAAARRRGADFSACRLAGERDIDGAKIDEYEYRLDKKWIRWRELIGYDPFGD